MAHAKRTGEQCRKRAITGATVCKSHGGGAAQVRAAAARRLEQARAEAAVVTLGLPRDVSPTEALLEEVRWTAGHVEWLRARVADLDPAALSWGVTTEVDKKSGEFPGTDTTREARPSVWYELYTRERAHLVKVSEAAIRAGVEERRVRLSEQQGALLAGVIQRVLAALGLTEEQQALVPVIVPREFRALAGGAPA